MSIVGRSCPCPPSLDRLGRTRWCVCLRERLAAGPGAPRSATSEVLGEPDLRVLGHSLEGAAFFEHVGSAGNDNQFVFAEMAHRFAVMGEYNVVILSHEHERGGIDEVNDWTDEVNSTTSGDDRRDVGFGGGRRPEGRCSTGTGTEVPDS